MPGRVIDELIARLRWQVDDAELKHMQKRVQGMRSQFDRFARTTAIAGAALTGVAFGISRTVIGFERNMNLLRATYLDAADDQIERLRNQALELGRTTQRTAADAAQAQVELARSGKSVAETFTAVPHVLNLAIAGELEMGEAAALVSSQLAGFQLDVNETGRVTDVLAAAASAAKTTVGEMGPALRQVGQLAGSAGLSIEQTSAAIGVLRNQGLMPEQAGTGLRNVLATLLTEPPAQAKQALARMGLSHGALRQQVMSGDFFGALRRLRGAGLDVASALQLFGREAGVAGLAMVQNIDAVEELSSELDNARGTANRMREEMEAGLPGALDATKSAIEGLLISVGDSGLTGAMVYALNVIKSFAAALSEMSGGVKIFTVALIAAGPALVALGVAFKVAAFGLSAWSFALRFQAVQALSALIFQLAQAIHFMVWYRAALLRETAATALSSAATWARTSAGAALNAVKSRTVILSLQTAAAATLTAARSAIATAATLALTKATWALNAALSVNAAAAFRAAAGWIAATVAMVAGKIAALAVATATWVLNAALLVNPIILIVAALIGVVALLWVFRDAVWSVVQSVVRVFLDALDWAKANWPLLLPILLGPFGLLVAAVIKYKDEIIGAFRTAFEWIKGAAEDVWEFLSGIFDKIKSAWDNSVGGLIGFAGDVLSTVGGVASDVVGGIGNVLGIGGGNDPPAAAPSTSVVHQTQQSNVTVETVNVQVPSGDPEAIASGMRTAMEDEYTNAALAHDTGTYR